MIVQFGQPSPWHVGQSSRRLYSPRSVGIGIRPRRCEIISSNSGLTLSYSLPSSARIGPRWNSTSSIAIFGTSAMRTRRIAFANDGSVSSRRRRIASGACDSTRIFISHPPAAAAAFRLRAVVGHRGHFLDPADPQARAGESADRGLGPGSGGLRLVPPRRAHPDVDRVDAFLLRGVRHALRGLHRGVRRGLVLRRLHDHASRGLRDRLGSRDVRERDDDVVVRRVDVRDPPARHGQAPSGFSGFGASGSGPSSSAPSSAASAAGGVGGWPCCRTGWRPLEIADRSSYVITFSSVRLTRTPGIVTRRPPTDTCPWTMNCRACRGVKAKPFRNVIVCSRRERIASTSSARTSSRLVPSSGNSPSRPSRRRSCSLSFSACLSFCRTRACSSRARWRNRRRTYCDRQSSFLFFSPYFFRSSFSALMRSASHGWEGRSNFARENFGSPNDSHLGRFLRLCLLFFLLLFLLAAFLGLLRLGGFEGGLLRDSDRQARPPVRPGALPADLLARLMPDALVRSDHLHAVDVVPPVDLDVGAERVQVEPGLPVFRPVHHPVRERLAEVAQRRLDLVRLLLGEVPEPIALRDRREVGDRLRDADPDARDRREGVRDPPRPVQVRVRHAHDVPEVFLHALELLRRRRALRFLFVLVLFLRGPLRSSRLRRGGRRLGLGRGLLLRHSTIPGWDTRPNFTSYIRVKESADTAPDIRRRVRRRPRRGRPRIRNPGSRSGTGPRRSACTVAATVRRSAAGTAPTPRGPPAIRRG